MDYIVHKALGISPYLVEIYYCISETSINNYINILAQVSLCKAVCVKCCAFVSI